MQPRLRIAVAGAGVGGLAAGIALTLAGHRVQVFDRFDAPRPVGSGLVVQPVGQKVLDWLGAGERARALGTPIRVLHGIEARTGIGTLSVRYDSAGAGLHGLGLHRAALFAALHERLVALGVTVRTGAEVVGQSAGRLRMQGGHQSEAFDLIVDALGAHSPLSPLLSRPLPYGALWTTLDWPETALPTDRLSQRYVAARRMVGVLPLGHLPGEGRQKVAFFWSLRADCHADWLTAGLTPWKSEALSIWPDLAPFLAQITDPAQMVLARYSHGTLRRPHAPGLVHIGDAAHRASPQLGQGANMALLDAAALAVALDMAPLDEALPLYARLRRGHLLVYQSLSRFLTPQYQSDSALIAALRDRVIAPLGRLPLVARGMGAIASGLFVPALGGVPDAPPPWAMDAADGP